MWPINFDLIYSRISSKSTIFRVICLAVSKSISAVKGSWIRGYYYYYWVIIISNLNNNNNSTNTWWRQITFRQLSEDWKFCFIRSKPVCSLSSGNERLDHLKFYLSSYQAISLFSRSLSRHCVCVCDSTLMRNWPSWQPSLIKPWTTS